MGLLDLLQSEAVNLALRTAHIVAAIGWIGTSFFFMWLDAAMTPHRVAKPGSVGELWMVHSGHFYHVDKMSAAPSPLPDRLHWFKWEAYATWLTGAALLLTTFHLGSHSAATALLGDAAFPGAQPLLGLGLLALAWLAYDAACRSRLIRAPLAFGALALVASAALCWALTRLMDGRAAYVHVGAAIGTAMVGNVLMTIIPNQRRMIAARLAGEEPDPALAVAAKARSVHNNYATLPVLVLMTASHYPAAFAHQLNWAVMAGALVVAALVRHHLNLAQIGRARAWPLVAAAAGGAALAATLA